jgi:hypothetical protein
LLIPSSWAAAAAAAVGSTGAPIVLVDVTGVEVPDGATDPAPGSTGVPTELTIGAVVAGGAVVELVAASGSTGAPTAFPAEGGFPSADAAAATTADDAKGWLAVGGAPSATVEYAFATTGTRCRTTRRVGAAAFGVSDAAVGTFGAARSLGTASFGYHTPGTRRLGSGAT